MHSAPSLQDYAAARDAFAQCVQLCPDYAKAWVSWAQMEKRTRLEALGDHLHRRVRRTAPPEGA